MNNNEFSNNWKKAKVCFQKIYSCIANVRRDFLNRQQRFARA